MTSCVHTVEELIQRYGPVQSNPPQAIRQELVAIYEEKMEGYKALKADYEKLRQEGQKNVSRPPVPDVKEVVIAYGTGWGRVIPREEPEGWQGRWLPALEWVQQQVFLWMKATDNWLRESIRLEGYVDIAPQPTEEAAVTMARFLCHGLCDCWRLRHPDAPEAQTHNAKQRSKRCVREHQLIDWDPLQLSLENFIARAIKGDKPRGNRSGKKAFRSGAVEQSMIFYDLFQLHQVRFGKVLGWQCPHHPHDVCEGPRCLKCETIGRDLVFNETSHVRHVVRRLLVERPTGPYHQELFWRCQGCGTYYLASYDRCPRTECPQPARKRGAAKSAVWVLGPSLMEAGDIPGRDGDAEEKRINRLAVHEAVKRLPRDLQQLVNMQLEGMTPDEMAEKLERPLSEVTTFLQEAMERLRAFLPDDFMTR